MSTWLFNNTILELDIVDQLVDALYLNTESMITHELVVSRIPNGEIARILCNAEFKFPVNTLTLLNSAIDNATLCDIIVTILKNTNPIVNDILLNKTPNDVLFHYHHYLNIVYQLVKYGIDINKITNGENIIIKLLKYNAQSDVIIHIINCGVQPYGNELLEFSKSKHSKNVEIYKLLIMRYAIKKELQKYVYETFGTQALKDSVTEFNKYVNGYMYYYWSFYYAKQISFWIEYRKLKHPERNITNINFRAYTSMPSIYENLKKYIHLLIIDQEFINFLITIPSEDFIYEVFSQVKNTKFYLALKLIQMCKFQPDIKLENNIVSNMIMETMEANIVNFPTNYNYLPEFLSTHLDFVMTYLYTTNALKAILSILPKNILMEIFKTVYGFGKFIITNNINIYKYITAEEFNNEMVNNDNLTQYNLLCIYVLYEFNDASKIAFKVAIKYAPYYVRLQNACFMRFTNFTLSTKTFEKYSDNIIALIDAGIIEIDDPNLWQTITDYGNIQGYKPELLNPFFRRMYHVGKIDQLKDLPVFNRLSNRFVNIPNLNGPSCIDGSFTGQYIYQMMNGQIPPEYVMEKCFIGNLFGNNIKEVDPIVLAKKLHSKYGSNNLLISEMEHLVKIGIKIGVDSVYGVVYSVTIRNKQYVVKVNKFDKRENRPMNTLLIPNSFTKKYTLLCPVQLAEPVIGIIINNIVKEYTLGFINIKGFQYDEKNKILYQLMEKLAPLNTLTMNDNTGLLLIFDILRTLYISHILCKYTHFDLHANNVMLRKINKPIGYKYKDKYITVNIGYIPVIIDHGFSRLETNRMVIKPMISIDRDTLYSGYRFSPYIDMLNFFNSILAIFPTLKTLVEKFKDKTTINFFNGFINADKTVPLQINGKDYQVYTAEQVLDFCFNMMKSCEEYSVENFPKPDIHYYNIPETAPLIDPKIIIGDIPTRISDMTIMNNMGFLDVRIIRGQMHFRIDCCHMNIIELLSSDRFRYGMSVNAGYYNLDNNKYLPYGPYKRYPLNDHNAEPLPNSCYVAINNKWLKVNREKKERSYFNTGPVLIWNGVNALSEIQDVSSENNTTYNVDKYLVTNYLVLVIEMNGNIIFTHHKNANLTMMNNHINAITTARHAVVLSSQKTRMAFKVHDLGDIGGLNSNNIYLPDIDMINTQYVGMILSCVV